MIVTARLGVIIDVERHPLRLYSAKMDANCLLRNLVLGKKDTTYTIDLMTRLPLYQLVASSLLALSQSSVADRGMYVVRNDQLNLADLAFSQYPSQFHLLTCIMFARRAFLKGMKARWREACGGRQGEGTTKNDCCMLITT
jgi:hypothetical protein